MKSARKTIIWVTLFSIAMGFMEAAVVIYLRALYYKSGFSFPLQRIDTFIGKVEFLREFATLIMLTGIGIVAGKTKLQRFAYFLLAFGIWDLFYYVFLYVFLGWPQSLNTWDILFLIPVPWVGPVWAPCLLSLLMIIQSIFVINKIEEDKQFKISAASWWMFFSGAFIVIVSFMWDYLAFTYDKDHSLFITGSKELFAEFETYVPLKFNYVLFLIGFILQAAPLSIFLLKDIKNSKSNIKQ